MKVNIQEYVEQITSDKDLLTKEGKVKMKDLNLVFKYAKVPSEVSTEIVAKLTSDGFITIAKGQTTYSPIQRVLVQFFNFDCPKQLMEKRKATLENTEELANELREEPEGIGFLNALGDLIVIKSNCDNVTQKRQVKRAKEQMEKLPK